MGFISKTKNSYKINEATLLNILKNNKNCEFGKQMNFENINSIEDYQNKLPLATWDYFETYITRMSQGEKNLLTSEEIEFFGQTSGTTGKQKLIPFTKSRRKRASKYLGLLNQKFAYDNFKKYWTYTRGLMITDIVLTKYTEAHIPIRSATSGGMDGIKSIIPYIFTSPLEVMKLKDKEAALYLHLLFALKEKKLLYISGTFISSILDLFRCFEKNYLELIKDIKYGRISHKLNLSLETRKSLNKLISPDANRAAELELAVKDGFKGICRKTWPNLAFLDTVTGGNFSIYDEKVNYYTDYLPIYSSVYASTEALIGLNPNWRDISYVIIPDTAFYEFIPINSEKSYLKPLLLNQLEKNMKYEIVITNSSGLYRYKLGDVIQVVGFYNTSPIIKFLYRKNQLLNMVSEKTTEDHINNCIKETMRTLNIDLVDYTTMANNNNSPGNYIFYLELKNCTTSTTNLENLIDTNLKKSNIAYGRFRDGNRLNKVKVVLLKENTFNSIKEERIKSGVSKSQIKIPRVIEYNSTIYNLLKKYL